jgi:hypothetical protein
MTDTFSSALAAAQARIAATRTADDAYTSELPTDIRQGRTGVPLPTPP